MGGRNRNGQLGLGDNEHRRNWEKVSFPSEIKAREVVIYCNSSFLITTEGKLYACGDNSNKCIALNYHYDINTWTEVSLPNDKVEVEEVYVDSLSYIIKTASDEFYVLSQSSLTWKPIPLPPETFSSSSALNNILDEVACYHDNLSVTSLVHSLSKEELLLVPYKMAKSEWGRLNQQAYSALTQSIQERNPPVHRLFTAPLGDYDSSVNYLTRLKDHLPAAAICSDARDDDSDAREEEVAAAAASASRSLLR